MKHTLWALLSCYQASRRISWRPRHQSEGLCLMVLCNHTFKYTFMESHTSLIALLPLSTIYATLVVVSRKGASSTIRTGNITTVAISEKKIRTERERKELEIRVWEQIHYSQGLACSLIS